MKRKIFQLILLWISGVTLSAQTTEPMPALIERGLSRAREQALVIRPHDIVDRILPLPQDRLTGGIHFAS